MINELFDCDDQGGMVLQVAEYHGLLRISIGSDLVDDDREVLLDRDDALEMAERIRRWAL